MIDGVLNIYKEKGYTSHDVVAKLRGILHQKKIGHTGTLDPDAEGALLVCLGKGTRLCDMLADKDKTYQATLLLGKETDTQDVSGQVLCEREVKSAPEEVRQAVMGFAGEYAQVPPMYSAIKVNGKKLYDLAREGKVVEREARAVTIYDIRIESIELPRAVMTVHCSKGTYIRTLCHDIGAKLGCGGCMESLVRTKAGSFSVEDSLTLAEVEKLWAQGELEPWVVPIEEMFRQYPAAVARPEADGLVHNGNPLKAEEVSFEEGTGQPESLSQREEAGRTAGTEDKAAWDSRRKDPSEGSLPQTESALHFQERERLGQEASLAERNLPRISGPGKKPPAFPAQGIPPGQRFRVYDSRRRFMGIYQWEQEKARLKPQKMFLGGQEG